MFSTVEDPDSSLHISSGIPVLGANPSLETKSQVLDFSSESLLKVS